MARGDDVGASARSQAGFDLSQTAIKVGHAPAEHRMWLGQFDGICDAACQIGDATDNLIVVEDVHNLGVDYDKTLMAWSRNFDEVWPRFEADLGERFYRMWCYYLLSCAGAFCARDIQL